ncbi:hypothetical protein L211DRAFT_845181 [Terfezia boudieri ATCC MYA-4762]|uniref:Uncharacterized protein n=1 Tax=Terfezia boudieri ATCC MYA-4762 TaxID=1051890 RepID=A0A3N4M985_9PEZI|nr:hypothetical protein L211DRAFT_845181 [Terfezia boudieri ATCC MYA-4762]
MPSKGKKGQSWKDGSAKPHHTRPGQSPSLSGYENDYPDKLNGITIGESYADLRKEYGDLQEEYDDTPRNMWRRSMSCERLLHPDHTPNHLDKRTAPPPTPIPPTDTPPARTYAEAATSNSQTHHKVKTSARTTPPRRTWKGQGQRAGEGDTTPDPFPKNPPPSIRARAVVSHAAPSKYKPGLMLRWIEEDNKGVRILGIRWLLQEDRRLGKLVLTRHLHGE